MQLLKIRIQKTLDSRNFFVNLLTIIFIAMNFNGAGIPEELAGSIVDILLSGDLTQILVIVIPNILNPLLKVIKTWDWDFLQSQNFWVQAITATLVGLSSYGLIFPESAASDLVDAVFRGEWGAIIAALVMNVINPLLYFFFDRDNNGRPAIRAINQTAAKMKMLVA